jgi:hypothetical protein
VESQGYEQVKSDDDTGGWNIPVDDPRCQAWIESDSKVVVSYPAVNRGWPSVEGGVKVSIEVHSDLKDSEEEHPACRLVMFTDCFSVIDLLMSIRYLTTPWSLYLHLLFSPLHSREFSILGVTQLLCVLSAP